MFESILGNEPIKAYLQKAIDKNTLSQTLLFAGPDGIGKRLVATSVAKRLLGSDHSLDLHRYSPEGKSGLYAIDTLREMMAHEHEAPYEASHKVFILEDVERMQPASANAILKTLEEPSVNTTFILLTSNPKEILPTILSRCTILNFQPIQQEEIETLLHTKGYPIHFAKLANGSIGKAFELAEHPEFENQRKILFDLLAKKPPYREVMQKLVQFDEKEGDPVLRAKHLEHLFSSILMWHRDQHLRQMNMPKELLFFPDEPKQEPSSLEEIQNKVDLARLAAERNMKLSVCLSQIFFPGSS